MNELLKPQIQIRTNSIICYNKFIGTKKKSVLVKATERLKSVEKYTGVITEGTRKRMEKAITLLIESTKPKIVYNPVVGKNHTFRLSFITLTIPDTCSLTSKEAHRLLLEPFLKWMRQVHKVKNYVWKLEVQKRGNIHYHITSDAFIVHGDLRNKWNKLIERASLMEKFKDKFGHNNPNSTDIHSVKKVKDLAAYLIKYFTKSEQNETGLKGKIWDCSLGLKKANYFTTDLTDDLEHDIYLCEQREECTIFRAERFTIIKFKKVSPLSIFPSILKEAYYQNLRDIANYERGLFDIPKKETVSVQKTEQIEHIKIMPKILFHQMDLFQHFDNYKN